MMTPCFAAVSRLASCVLSEQTDRQAGSSRQAGRQAGRQQQAGRQAGRRGKPGKKQTGRQAGRGQHPADVIKKEVTKMSKCMTDSIDVPILCAELTISLHVKAPVTADCLVGTMQTVW